MRRILALTAIALTLTLAGCSSMPGTGGNVVGHGPVMRSAGQTPPAGAGSCHYYGTSRDFSSSLPGSFSFIEPADIAQTRDCVPADSTASSGVHDTETAYVGTFSNADADSSTPPAQGSAGRRNAYTLCQSEVNDYLGGDWHQTGVWIMLALPSDTAWRDGARWYRCDIGRMDSPVSGGQVMRGTVRDGLTGDHPLAVTCLTTNETSAGQVVYSAPVTCDQPHAAEYAGSYTAPPTDYPATDDKATQQAEQGCADVVARYLGFTNAARWNNDAIGYLSLGFDKERWQLGDRSTRCFAYALTNSKTITGSIEGIRTGKPMG
jgi:hypothetical protein